MSALRKLAKVRTQKNVCSPLTPTNYYEVIQLGGPESNRYGTETEQFCFSFFLCFISGSAFLDV